MITADDLVAKSFLKFYYALGARQIKTAKPITLIMAKVKNLPKVNNVTQVQSGNMLYSTNPPDAIAENSIIRLENYFDLNESALNEDLTEEIKQIIRQK